MISTDCILNVFSPEMAQGGVDLRLKMPEFLQDNARCRILGAGRSCMERGYFDIEIQFESEKEAGAVVKELRSKFSTRCELDIDWM